ncbi:hypothetical protein R1T40_14295 [Tritonibacter scottomollicae]|uniref:Lipoprotein n=1 Tax=Tritonibacter scottomollicae TaxID=483013 RepID=A0ABZ0HDU1_TRISK|nr:hypothetical protein [Tritonibacter scottomollicae]WOI32124.1 hypothetical protein R1T40_14295 [Tritonibacter scottomollicae]
MRPGNAICAAGFGVVLMLVGACDLYLPEEQALSGVTPTAALLPISQAPYRYQDATYWTLANGCTYSPGPAPRGGWRWFLVGNPMSRGHAMIHDGCDYTFDAAR